MAIHCAPIAVASSERNPRPEVDAHLPVWSANSRRNLIPEVQSHHGEWRANSRISVWEVDSERASRPGVDTCPLGAENDISPDFLPATIEYYQADGPFVYPANVFQQGLDFYRTQTVGGNNAVKYVFMPNNPNFASCDSLPGPPPPPSGFVNTSWTGLTTWDYPFTGPPIRTEQVGVIEYGALPPLRSARPPFVVKGDDFDDLVHKLGLLNVQLAWAHEYNQYTPDFAGNPHGTYTRRMYTGKDEPGNGYFVMSFFNTIYCGGKGLTVQYVGAIPIWELGYPVVRTGDPARTQVLTSYNDVTRTFVGNKSKVINTVTIAPGQTQLVGDYTFLVTPLVGAPYRLYLSTEQDVSTSGPLPVTFDYPTILGTVYLEEVHFTKFGGKADDFERFAEDDVLSLPGDSNWPQELIFRVIPPTTECWDNFENYDIAIQGAYVDNLGTGWGWPGAGLFSLLSRAACEDSFESYPVGDALVIGGGTGWAERGKFAILFQYSVWDDFEAYAVGPITSFTTFTGYYWMDTGGLRVFAQPFADDDFESYTVGPVTLINGGTGPWVGNGGFYIKRMYYGEDDHESYATGAIAATTAGGVDWAGSGNFH